MNKPNAVRLESQAESEGFEPLETLLSFSDAARVLGVSLRQFRRIVDSGRIAFVRISKRTPRIRPSELQRFIETSAVKYSQRQAP